VFLSDSPNQVEEYCFSVCVLLNFQRHLADLTASQCTRLAICNYFNPLTARRLIRARFQQLLDFSISAASGCVPDSKQTL
jgi:hypothetical protein